MKQTDNVTVSGNDVYDWSTGKLVGHNPQFNGSFLAGSQVKYIDLDGQEQTAWKH